MKISVLTKQGTSKKLNTDCILVLSEDAKDNPILIDSQKYYSHYIDTEVSFLAIIADGLGADESALMAAKTTIDVFSKHFDVLIDTVSEQDIMYHISDLFARIEIEIAKTVGQNKELVGASASLSGIVYNKNVGIFTFNAGDVRVYKKEKDSGICAITQEHTSKDGTIENFAGGGGNHYITSTGPIVKRPLYHLIANQGFYEHKSLLGSEFNSLYESGDSGIIIDKVRNNLENSENSASMIHIFY